MYKPSIYLVVTYFPRYLPIDETYILKKIIIEVKPNINSDEVHPQLSNYRHRVDDGALLEVAGNWVAKVK
jgi:hypothetical protein